MTTEATVSDNDNTNNEEEEDDDDECNEWDDASSGTLTSFALCVSQEGSVCTFGSTAWESNFTSRLPRSMSDDGVSNISCGPDYCLAIDCLGRCWIWGDPQWLDLHSDESMKVQGKRNSFAQDMEEYGGLEEEEISIGK